MKVFRILKYVAFTFMICGFLDFALFFITFNSIFEIIGFYILIIAVPLAIILLGYVMASLSFLPEQNKKIYSLEARNAIIALISGILLSGLIMLTYFKIEGLSRLKIQNNCDDVIYNITIFSDSDLLVKKDLKKIKPQKAKRFYINKLKYKKWNISYIQSNIEHIDSFQYYRNIIAPSNDELIVTDIGIIDRMYETIVWENL